VAVVTDSAASLPGDLAAARGISVVPLHLVVGGRAVRDGDVTLDELLARLDEGVSTSGPSPGEFTVAVDARVAQGADAVLVLCISSEMSSTFDAARVAAAAIDAPVRVVDTGTAAGAQGLVALAAAAWAADGLPLDDVEVAAKEVCTRVRLVATLPNLDRLVASGRVPGIAGWAGRRLGVNPLFEFRQGRVRPLRPAFARDAALARIVSAVREERREGARLHAAALHAHAEQDATRLLAAVTEGVEVAESFVGPFSPVMVSHTGPGLVGIAWWWEASRP
jgi:DegV family protein with EDD domain